MPPPPKCTFFREGGLKDTDYFAKHGPWMETGLPWLECHRGQLYLLIPGKQAGAAWAFAGFCYLTRGLWKDTGQERLELYFPAEGFRTADSTLTLSEWQCNRFPGWQPGKRCWKLHVYCSDYRSPAGWGHFFWRTVFWRRAPLPCAEPWEGPRQDGVFPNAKELRHTDREHRAWLEGLHHLNGTYDHKTPKRLCPEWIDILRRRCARPGEDGDDPAW